MMPQRMGNEIRTAHDGLEAVHATEVFRPAVVLLDIGLPRLNDDEAARRIVHMVEPVEPSALEKLPAGPPSPA